MTIQIPFISILTNTTPSEAKVPRKDRYYAGRTEIDRACDWVWSVNGLDFPDWEYDVPAEFRSENCSHDRHLLPTDVFVLILHAHRHSSGYEESSIDAMARWLRYGGIRFSDRRLAAISFGAHRELECLFRTAQITYDAMHCTTPDELLDELLERHPDASYWPEPDRPLFLRIRDAGKRVLRMSPYWEPHDPIRFRIRNLHDMALHISPWGSKDPATSWSRRVLVRLLGFPHPLSPVPDHPPQLALHGIHREHSIS